MLWRLYPGFRFLLKRMNDPDVITDLHRIYNAKCIPAKWQCNFKNTAFEAFERLRIIGLPALRSNSKCCKNVETSRLWKTFEFFPGRLDPGNRSCLAHPLRLSMPGDND
jgi:hypothetical protein